MGSMSQFETLKTLLGGFATAIGRWAQRVSQLEIDAKQKDALVSELLEEADRMCETAAALKQLWQETQHREGLRVEQVKLLTMQLGELDSLREQVVQLRRTVKEQADCIYQHERSELERGVWQVFPDTDLAPVSDVNECPDCGAENLVLGAKDVCSCPFCESMFQLRF